MSHESAAIFAQVLPVLFIANYLTNRHRLKWMILLSVGTTITAEGLLLIAVAEQTNAELITDVFTWVAVTMQLIMILITVYMDAILPDSKRDND